MEKVERNSFLIDIRNTSPDYTYILNYVTPGGARHAAYVESCDHNFINCLNSWGKIEPQPKISLHAEGHIFYRVFCTTFLVLSSSGPSSEHHGDCLGVFEYHLQLNDCPAYRQRHTVAGTQPYYLYRDEEGDWIVGPELGGTSCCLLNTTKNETVPRKNWLYAVDDDDDWVPDPKLNLSSSLPSVCGDINISLDGPAASAKPETEGEYRPTADWRAGHPVFSNGVTYLTVVPRCSKWQVTYSPESDVATLQSGSVSWCPASTRAALSFSDNQSLWQYSYNGLWHNGDIQVTCDSHLS